MPEPSRWILDTDILSAVMRNVPSALSHAEEYLARQNKFSFSVITRYEILRGLAAKGAYRQIDAFRRFCDASETLYLTDTVVERAADIFADLKSTGRLIGDADILIAATVLENGSGLVTNNENHFKRIANLPIDNWLA